MTTHLPHRKFRFLAFVSTILLPAAPIVGAQEPAPPPRWSTMLAAPANFVAAPAANPDFSSTGAAPEPRFVSDEVALANKYLAGRGVAQDLKMAASLYEKAAGAGDPVAQFRIGYFYETGVGVEKNPERAAHWYQLAASSGLPVAKVDLGIAYLWGTGVPKNERLAFELMHEAAAQGSGLAACYVGDFYFFGMGVSQNKSEAERWYRKGASLHNPIAEFDLASMLIQSKDGQQDLRAETKLLRLSAAAGYVPAMQVLGMLLVRNPGFAVSSGEAVKLLNGAADAGNWRSSMLLGVLARDGIGVPADNGAAYYHFRVAALQGGEDASKLVAYDLHLLSAKLGAGRVQAVDAEANEWYRQHHFVLAFVEENKEGRSGFPPFALVAADTATHAEQMLISPAN